MINRAKTFAFFVIVVLSVAGASAAMTNLPQPVSPIQHIVIIMMENQTYDHFFGTFPKVSAPYSLPLNQCQPTTSRQQSKYHYPPCIYPFNADSFSTLMQAQPSGHGTVAERAGYDNGSMDGFVAIQSGQWANLSVSYVTGQTLPNYWDYASYYALNVNFFSSILSYSWPNHLFLATTVAPSSCATTGGGGGNSGGCQPEYDLTYPNIVQGMNATGIDWAYFQALWSDKNQCHPINSNYKFKGFIHYWNVFPDWPSIQDGQSTCHRIQNTNDLSNDVASGYLPQVSWVVPAHNESDHSGCGNSSCTIPMSPLPSGQIFVSNIINKISANPTLWSSTAIFLTWDDPGGYYDNVTPTQVDQFGYGFRAPLLVISPYVKQGISYGSGQQQDFTAFLATIEHNWNLPPIGGRDTTVGDLFYMFDFSQTPRPPLILPSNVLATYPLSTCSVCHYGTSITPFHAPVGLNLPQLSQSDGECVPFNNDGDPCD